GCSPTEAIPLTLPSPHPLSREPIPRDGERDQGRGAFEYEICGLGRGEKLGEDASRQPPLPSPLLLRASGGEGVGAAGRRRRILSCTRGGASANFSFAISCRPFPLFALNSPLRPTRWEYA